MLGIDVSKATLCCTLLHSETGIRVWEREVPNTPAGIAVLLQKTPPDVPWALEPTGRYSQTVARTAYEAGREVLLAQPKKAKNFLASIQSRAKTDSLDSNGLAHYARAHKLPPYPLKTPMAEQLDQLLSARRGLSQTIASLEARRRELPHAAAHLQEAIAALKQQRRGLDREIALVPKLADEARLIVTHSTPTLSLVTEPSDSSEQSVSPAIAAPSYAALIKELQRVPGFGPVTASTVVSRLTSRYFSTSDKFVAYSGFDVSVRQSGNSKGSGALTKQGDAELRRVLYLAAQASLRAKDSPFKMQYDKERAKGLSSTAAICAIARKMARLSWSIVTFGTSYDPDRIYNQPTKRDIVDKKPRFSP